MSRRWTDHAARLVSVVVLSLLVVGTATAGGPAGTESAGGTGLGSAGGVIAMAVALATFARSSQNWK